MLSLIYARSENFCIGKRGQVPWHLPDEFAHFRRTTLHHTVIMGRRTYEDHQTLLPDRVNIVVTKTPGYVVAEGVLVADSLAAALQLAAREGREIFVVGGVGLFEQSFSRASRVFETVVHTAIVGGDTFVPAFDFTGFARTTLEQHPADSRHPFSFTVTLYERTQTPSSGAAAAPPTEDS